MPEPRCTGLKICERCRAPLHVLAFEANPKSEDGLEDRCRDCRDGAAATSRRARPQPAMGFAAPWNQIGGF